MYTKTIIQRLNQLRDNLSKEKQYELSEDIIFLKLNLDDATHGWIIDKWL